MTRTKAAARRLTPAGPLRIGLAAGVLLLAGCESGPRMPQLRMPSVLQPAACDTFSVSIYFEAGSAAVTREAEALVRSAAGRARRCKVTAVDVVGLADAAGASADNLQLSKDRASAVTEALGRHGFANVTIDQTAAGEAGAQGPLRRRADVTFHLEAKPK